MSTAGKRPVVKVGSWEELGEAARKVRLAVFVQEQGIPVELEMDTRDAACVHAVAFDHAGQPIATGRLLPDAHIGRMAVLKEQRGRGLGRDILHALIAVARRRGDQAVRLHAQISAAGFYANDGFQTEGEDYLEAGIPHRTMALNLAPV